MEFISSLYHFGLEIATSLQHAQPVTVSFVFAALIIAASIVITVRMPMREARILFVAIFAALTFVLSHGISGESNDFFFNLSTEFVGAAVGLFLFADVLFDELGGWLLLIAVAAVTLFAPMVVQQLNLPFISSQFILNLRTDLLGAFIVAVLLNREWVIHSDLKRAYERGQSQISKLDWLQEQKRINRERLQDMKRLQAELKQQAEQLDQREKQIAAMQEALAEQRSGKRKLLTTTHSRQIMMIVEGQAALMPHVERTLDQVFEIKAHESLQNDGSPFHRVYFTIDAPDKSFGQELQARLEKLIQDWNEQSKQAQTQGDFADENSPQTVDYLYGIASGYQLAMDDLRALIVSMETE